MKPRWFCGMAGVQCQGNTKCVFSAAPSQWMDARCSKSKIGRALRLFARRKPIQPTNKYVNMSTLDACVVWVCLFLGDPRMDVGFPLERRERKVPSKQDTLMTTGNQTLASDPPARRRLCAPRGGFALRPHGQTSRAPGQNASRRIPRVDAFSGV